MLNNFTECSSPIESSESKIISIIDFEAFIVEIFLNYLYTDTLDITQATSNDSNSFSESKQLQSDWYTHVFIELFKISDKYNVHRLKKLCETKLLKHVTVETTIELLILSYLHSSSRLKLQCFQCLTENVTCIISQSSWSHVERNYPGLLAEAFRVLYFKQNH